MSASVSAIERTSRAFDSTPRLRVMAEKEIAPCSKSFEKKISALYHRIESGIETSSARVVALTGYQSTEEGFTYTYELARMTSQQLGKRVLVLTTAGAGFVTHVMRHSFASGWQLAAAKGEIPEHLIYDLSEPQLSVSQLNTRSEDLPKIASDPAFKEILQQLRGQYDLILLDTPAFSEGMEAQLLAPFADGLILIVDAGAARWQVMRHLVQDLLSQHVKVLGVVLNKRRHYIPSFIYNKL